MVQARTRDQPILITVETVAHSTKGEEKRFKHIFELSTERHEKLPWYVQKGKKGTAYIDLAVQMVSIHYPFLCVYNLSTYTNNAFLPLVKALQYLYAPETPVISVHRAIETYLITGPDGIVICEVSLTDWLRGRPSVPKREALCDFNLCYYHAISGRRHSICGLCTACSEREVVPTGASSAEKWFGTNRWIALSSATTALFGHISQRPCVTAASSRANIVFR